MLDPKNRPATAMLLDLRNSTALHRMLSKKNQRMKIVEMMCGIHKEIMDYLYNISGVNENDLAYNDTGDGYIIAFANQSHAISCLLCASHLRNYLTNHLSKFNSDLNLNTSANKYGYGIGMHTASARFIEMNYKATSKKEIKKNLFLAMHQILRHVLNQ